MLEGRPASVSVRARINDYQADGRDYFRPLKSTGFRLTRPRDRLDLSMAMVRARGCWSKGWKLGLRAGRWSHVRHRYLSKAVARLGRSFSETVTSAAPALLRARAASSLSRAANGWYTLHATLAGDDPALRTGEKKLLEFRTEACLSHGA